MLFHNTTENRNSVNEFRVTLKRKVTQNKVGVRQTHRHAVQQRDYSQYFVITVSGR